MSITKCQTMEDNNNNNNNNISFNMEEDSFGIQTTDLGPIGSTDELINSLEAGNNLQEISDATATPVRPVKKQGNDNVTPTRDDQHVKKENMEEEDQNKTPTDPSRPDHKSRDNTPTFATLTSVSTNQGNNNNNNNNNYQTLQSTNNQNYPGTPNSHLSHGSMPASQMTSMSNLSTVSGATNSRSSHIQSWQNHGYYGVDSGINSINPSGQPSIATASRAGSEMPRNYRNGTYTPSVMSSHMTEFSLPSIASTNTNASFQNQNPYSNMGPDSVKSNSAMSNEPHSTSLTPTSQAGSSMPTTPNRPMSQPNSQVNTPQRVVNQIADNVDQVERILPEVLRHLHDPDEQVFSQAAAVASKLIKYPNGLQAIIQSTNIITALLKLVDTNKTANLPLVQKSIAKVIYEISEEKATGARRDGIQVLVKNGAIRTLMILLVSPNPNSNCRHVATIQSYSVSSLHNILQFATTPQGRRMRNNRQFDIKKMVREEGGTERLTLLLKNQHNKFLAICADSLFILAHNSPESKIRIFQAGGLEELIRIMANSTYYKLLNPCSRVLKVLSTCKHNKERIVRLGGMQALGRHLANQTPQTAKLVSCCLWALRNLSDVATKQPNMDGVLKLLLDRVNHGDELTVQCAAGALMNLTCNNQVNKQIVFQSGGVDTIIRKVMQFKDYNILEPLLCCLRNLSCRHPEAYNAAMAFRSHYWVGLFLILFLYSFFY